MAERLPLQNKLTSKEIEENNFNIESVQRIFLELGLKIEKTKYDEVIIPIKVIKEFSELAKLIALSRHYVLNMYFVYKDSDLDWEQIQNKLRKDMKLFLWINEHSILRNGVIKSVIAILKMLKRNSERYSQRNVKIKKIFDSISIPEKGKIFKTGSLDERIKFVNLLLDKHYNMLIGLSNVSN